MANDNSTPFLPVSYLDRLNALQDAYIGLEVLSGLASDADSRHSALVLAVINGAFVALVEDIQGASRGSVQVETLRNAGALVQAADCP